MNYGKKAEDVWGFNDLLYMRMSGVQMSLDGSRILFTPSNSLSFHDNL